MRTMIKPRMFLGIFSASEVMMARKQAAKIELSEQERGIFVKIIRSRILGSWSEDVGTIDLRMACRYETSGQPIGDHRGAASVEPRMVAGSVATKITSVADMWGFK
ncbi:MAG: hypothetical protein LBJ67_02630 [Planctomycetaceae bacterium]|nr:hypothetical protein [Planctomycetaceae bacterium]